MWKFKPNWQNWKNNMARARINEDGIYVVSDSINMYRYSMEGSIESMIEYLNTIHLEAVARGMVGEGSIDFSTSRGYYDSVELEITFDFVRTETEKERIKREAAEAKAIEDKKAEAARKRQLKKDAEWKEFQRLKAKFGDSM